MTLSTIEEKTNRVSFPKVSFLFLFLLVLLQIHRKNAQIGNNENQLHIEKAEL